MGDPKKSRNKYSTPVKAWEKQKIEEERGYIKEFYFKNKKEIWMLNSKLRNFARQAKRLITSNTEQAEKEKLQLLNRLKLLGLLSESGNLDDVLDISIEDIFQRRLQSIVFKKGLARTMKQARQFIVHEHILVDGKKLTSPNYLVPISKESTISFSQNSSLADEMHPERVQEEKMPKKPEEKKSSEKKESNVKKEEKPQEKKKAKPKEEKDSKGKKSPEKEETKE